MRGYQKRVIYLKNTGSKSFEEAYFVMRESEGSPGVSQDKMIEEANRIIAENFGSDGRGFLYTKRWYILAFLAGCAITVVLFIAAWLIGGIA